MKWQVPSDWRNLACHKLLGLSQLTPRKWDTRSFSAVTDLHHCFSQLVILEHKIAIAILWSFSIECLDKLVLRAC